MSQVSAQRVLGPRRAAAVGGAAVTAAAVVTAIVGYLVSDATLVTLFTVLLIVLAAIAAVALSRRDAVTALTAMLACLFLIPENFVVQGPLKSVGTPSVLIGLLCLVLWLAARLLGVLPARPMHPVRWAIWFFALTSLTAFAVAMTRVLGAQESGSATRTVFPVLAIIGITMLAVDGLENVRDVTRLLWRFVVLVGVQGAIGILEYAVKLDYRSVTLLPGLRINTELNVTERSGFSRISAAAANPIEFSVILATAVPLALHFALHAPTSKQRRAAALLLALMMLALPLPVARSGILGVAVGLAIYAVVLTARARLNLLVLMVIGLALFRVAVPGLLGTLRSFFTAGSADDSVTGRTEDYAAMPSLMEGHWWFGRGFGTFQPQAYFYLDNQYLMTLLNGGLVALAALIALFVVGMSCARGARKRFAEQPTRDQCQAIAAAIACLAVTAGTFDEFSFLQCAFSLAVLIGCAGALWTLSQRRTPATRAAAQPAEDVRAGS